MLIYILKFSGCLFLFLGFYKLFLERESFHKLKRCYLLSALLVPLCIPFITFTEYIELVPLENTYVSESSDVIFQETIIETTWRDYVPQILWSLYSIGVLIFSFRFAKHLHQLYVRIKTNPKFKEHTFTNVLLSHEVNPHTFFKYIFFNKVKFENNLIPKEVILHEQTHAKQLHALDIIIVEFLQIIFWFNPLLYFIKKDIKLNHEFLADQSVLKEFTEPKAYQQLLLAFSSSAQEHQLANAINYSSIKKRFTVMKTHTSKTRTWVKSFILLPLLAVLVYGFSSEKIEYVSTEENASSLNLPVELYEDAETSMSYNNQEVKALQTQATLEQLKEYNTLAKQYNKQPEATRVVKLKDLKQMEIIYKLMSVEQKQGAEQFPNCPPTPEQEGASKKQVAEYNTLATKYNVMPKNNMTVILSDVKRIRYLYNLMSYKQRKDAEPFPDFPPPPPAPIAPLAPEVLEQIPPPPPPPISPLDHIIDMAKKNAIFYLEGKKISSDRAIEALKNNKSLNVESIGSNSKQPKVYITKKGVTIEKKTPSNKTGFININGKKLFYVDTNDKITYYNRYGVATDKQGNELGPNKQVNANSVLPNSKITKVFSEDKIVSEFKNDDFNRTSSPPEDISMLQLANKGAIFYYEGQEISGKRAITLTDNNEKLNILIRGIDSKKPIVKISKKPIRI